MSVIESSQQVYSPMIKKINQKRVKIGKKHQKKAKFLKNQIHLRNKKKGLVPKALKINLLL